MEAKGRGFLKVCGILMIIGGVLGLLAAVVMVLGISALVSVGAPVSATLLTVAAVIILAGSVFQLIVGIQGVKNCGNVEAADKLIKLGAAIIVINIIGVIVSVAAGGEFNIVSVLTNCIVPGLFIYGAVKNKQ